MSDGDVAIALGGNIGSPRIIVARMQGVIDAFRAHGAIDLKVSQVYKTKPVETQVTQPYYLNSVFRVKHNELWTDPLQLLGWTQTLEKEQGRKTKSDLMPRKLDIDLLWLGDRKVEAKQLTLPHPRMHRRRFILRPLLDVYSRDFKHEHLLTDLGSLLESAPNEPVTTMGPLLS